MKIITLVNGSPRGNKSSSFIFLKYIERFLDIKDQKIYINVKLKKGADNPKESIETLANSDIIIFSFPLYSYTLPAPFTKLIEELYYYKKNNIGNVNSKTKVYTIVNCGYAKAEINIESLRVMKLFCNRMNYDWRFGIGIGSGMLVAMMKNIPIVNYKFRKACKTIAKDISTNTYKEYNDIFFKSIIPITVSNYMKDSSIVKYFMKKGI